MLIRIAADVLVNYYTTYWFLKGKTTDAAKYYAWIEGMPSEGHANPNLDLELSVCERCSHVADAREKSAVRVPLSGSIENNHS